MRSYTGMCSAIPSCSIRKSSGRRRKASFTPTKVPTLGKTRWSNSIFGRLPADWDDWSVSAEEILGGGDLGGLPADAFGEGIKPTELPSTPSRWCRCFQCKDGKIAKCQTYADTAQFKESIGRIRVANV